MILWLHGFMVTRFYGYRFIDGYVVIWLYSFMVTWLYGYMVICKIPSVAASIWDSVVVLLCMESDRSPCPNTAKLILRSLGDPETVLGAVVSSDMQYLMRCSIV